MEVPARYGCARPITRVPDWPADPRGSACLALPRMTARARSRVPVSYPWSVGCFQNGQERRSRLSRCLSCLQPPLTCPQNLSPSWRLRNEFKGGYVGWPHDAEVSAVERRERADLHAFRDDDEAGVGAAEPEVSV